MYKSAEIGKSYNVNNLKDVDSNENNKDENEDDYSTAEVIISIKTGVLVNVLKILGCIILLAIIFFGIKKYKNLGKLLAILILFINIISFLPKNTFAGVTVGVTYGDLKYHIRNGAWELVKADGKYWCINPGVHLCGLLHAYDMNWVGNFTSNEELVTAISGNYGVTVPNLGINVYPADTTPIDIGESQSSESAIKCSFYNNSKILVGPYKFDWTYSNTQMTSYEILDK